MTMQLNRMAQNLINNCKIIVLNRPGQLKHWIKKFSVDLQKNFQNNLVIINKLSLSDRRGKSMHYPESPKVNGDYFHSMKRHEINSWRLLFLPCFTSILNQNLSIIMKNVLSIFKPLLGVWSTQVLVQMYNNPHPVPKILHK